MFFQNIKKLVTYGIQNGLLPESERIYTTNLLLDIFGEEQYKDSDIDSSKINLPEILSMLTDEAVRRNLIPDSPTYRDLFDTKLMNCLLPRPSQIQNTFWDIYSNSKEAATDYYYKFSQDSNYIRRDRISRDRKWKIDSPYGKIDITINLSKPEKDPKAIAAAGKCHSEKYPKCQLCMENEGYAGRPDHPARQNHRIIPITLQGEKWGFQYSPYVYYNEHCIVFNGQHVPMKINQTTFEKLFDFLDLFPHYFLGSNADLPIVGGSILSHDHFQGGHYTFAMENAPIEKILHFKGFENVEAGIVHWPLSVIRLRSTDRKCLTDLATHILNFWRGYTDSSTMVFAETNNEAHNTITPIARMKGDAYELDLALRNNLTTEEYPLGLYHPHPEYHHIKKENIGLIEVMGLAVLPARLAKEMELVKEYILQGKNIQDNATIASHADWVDTFLPKYAFINADNISNILQNEIGIVFTHVLEDAGVYKCTPEGREAFSRFINYCNDRL